VKQRKPGYRSVREGRSGRVRRYVATVRYANGSVFTVPPGHRHATIDAALAAATKYIAKQEEFYGDGEDQ